MEDIFGLGMHEKPFDLHILFFIVSDPDLISDDESGFLDCSDI